MLLMTLAEAADPVDVDAGSICTRGEVLGSATVERVQQHPEFERCWLRAADGGMVAEIVVTDPSHAGQCTGGGRTLFPRPELVEGPVGRISLDPVCARLTAVPAATPGVWAPRLVALAGLTALLVAGILARGRVLALLSRFALALVARALLTSPALFDGGGAGYEKQLVGMGLSHNAGWGPGYALWMRPAVRMLGATPSAIFTTNLLFAALWPALIGWLGDRLWGTRAGWAAALAATFLPSHLTISWSEALHVSAATWGTLAVVGAAELGAGRRIGALLALAAGVAAVATRADLIVVVPAVVIVGAALAEPRLRWRAVAAGLAVGVAAAPFLTGGAGALRSDAPVTFQRVVVALLPHFRPVGHSGGYLVAAHAALTPVLWWGLAAIGVWSGRRAGLAAALWCLVASVPFLLKVEPAPDALRLQAFAQGGFVLLVGAGVARSGRWGVGLLVIGSMMGPALAGPSWLHREEWRFLAREVPALPGGAVVYAPGERPHREAFFAVMEALGPARWTAEAPAGAVYRYDGPHPARSGENGAVKAVNVDRPDDGDAWTFAITRPE